MAKIDLTITISVIVALCAIISPILTALINNHHQKHMKQMELNQQLLEKTVWHRREIFENYLQAAGRYAHNPDIESSKAYGESYLAAYMYAPTDARKMMECADDELRAHECEFALATIQKITHALLNSCEATK